MKTDNTAARRASRLYLQAADCDLDDLRALTGQQTVLSDYPHAASVEKNILLYDCDAIRRVAQDPQSRREIMAEWCEAFATGPGVIVLKRAEADLAAIDRASEIFFAMIAQQNAGGTGGGDHFAKPGANDRIWNSLEKHCLEDPENFVRYYGNDMLAMASQAWLGPCYQMTAQVNCVNPGGASQSPHRDYHLGFLAAGEISSYPRHVHALSPVLTLQGAIAHVDAPLETGPTLFLPFSQAYAAGYLATGLQAFKDHFVQNHVQLPLEKGDMVFFNPALFHAAGANRSKDVKRLVNLFQVSSAFGRAMETVDRLAMSKALYPALLAASRDGSLSPRQSENAIAASAEGYSFPTSLDRDPPLGGLAPKTQAALVRDALAAGTAPAGLNGLLDAQAARKAG